MRISWIEVTNNANHILNIPFKHNQMKSTDTILHTLQEITQKNPKQSVDECKLYNSKLMR